MTDFVSLSELNQIRRTDTMPLAKMLHRLGFAIDERPTLRALVLGVAKKTPYGDRQGRVAHAYAWSLDRLKPFLPEEDR